MVFISGRAQERTLAERHTVYVSSISWHTGVVIPAYALPDSLWGPQASFADTTYLEIGWGDADFFPNDRFNVWYALKAIFFPTASVLHVNPIFQPIASYYHDTDVVRISMNDDQLKGLSQFLIQEFKRDNQGRAIPEAEGFYPESQFYKSSSYYYFPNNSNVWAARAIRHAGFSLRPLWYQTTGWVLNKMEDFGQLMEQ
ncbi:DUF2459 domain-containing protein [Anditalea andensis]|uniref:DUF2459 domain-containing protein n=1 Tax=Anditalea andensis TaxID=1048983 RepID=A0A074L3N1_9BACT|nr:DUF2459 domain-containing protein [Anditalea andensis]KEO75784.1 hypothetical protein EL17_22425 [Anditalea andensis]